MAEFRGGANFRGNESVASGMSTNSMNHRIASCVTTLAFSLVVFLAGGSLQAQVPDFSNPEGDQSAGTAITDDEALDGTILAIEELAKARMKDKAWEDSYKRAANLSNKVLERDPYNIKARYIQGRLALMTNRPREGLPLIEAYVNSPIGARDATARILLGDLYLVSYPEHALTQYREACEIKDNDPEPFIGRAKANIKLNRAEDAVADAQTAIRNDREKNASYRQVLAEALLMLPDQQGQAAEAAREAVEITERRIRENPGDVYLFNDLKSEYELLVQCYSKMYEKQKNNPEVVVNVIRTIQDQADLQRLIAYHNALTMVQEARKGKEMQGSAALMLEEARLNRLLGKNDRAVEVLDELLKVDPGNDAARELRGIINGSTTPPADNLSAAGTGNP